MFGFNKKSPVNQVTEKTPETVDEVMVDFVKKVEQLDGIITVRGMEMEMTKQDIDIEKERYDETVTKLNDRIINQQTEIERASNAKEGISNILGLV